MRLPSLLSIRLMGARLRPVRLINLGSNLLVRPVKNNRVGVESWVEQNCAKPCNPLRQFTGQDFGILCGVNRVRTVNIIHGNLVLDLWPLCKEAEHLQPILPSDVI